jgi:hypothetical protein
MNLELRSCNEVDFYLFENLIKKYKEKYKDFFFVVSEEVANKLTNLDIKCTYIEYEHVASQALNTNLFFCIRVYYEENYADIFVDKNITGLTIKTYSASIKEI